MKLISRPEKRADKGAAKSAAEFCAIERVTARAQSASRKRMSSDTPTAARSPSSSRLAIPPA